ncbi:MAG: type II toxin-antitoxin system VapC family toxin [Rhizonema sp. NSF051]|nr:type II toxin-antitoxin system VapC family toxin [Rhizonema sp. NSF051]
MSVWILDTDTISLFQNQHLLLKQRVNQVSLEEIAVTVITVEEQMRGWLNVIRQSSEEQRLMWGYLALRQGVEFFNTIKILDFDQNSASRYAELLRQKIRIGTQDLRIAAIAISNNAILVTRNQRDFSRVPGLQIEDWTITINN